MNKYLIFDERSNLIEECEYGEGYSITKHTGSKVSIYHFKNYKKIDDKNFYYYDSTNKLISEEYWHYRNNKKYELGLKYHYLYDKNNVKIAYINKENDTISYNIIKTNDTLINEKGIKFRVQYEDTIFYNILGSPNLKREYYKNEFRGEVIYFYNEKNILIKEVKKNNIKILEPEIIIYKYNTIDSIVSVVSSRKYSLNGNYYYSYFKNGKLKRIKNYYKNLPHRTFSYKYKKINN